MSIKRFLGKKQLAALLALAVLLVVGCAGLANSGTGSATTVSVGVVSSVTVTDQIETSGNLEAGQLAKLSWGTSGTVEQVSVKVGQTVSAGQTLASLKTDSVPASVVTAQSDLASAQQELDTLLTSDSAEAAAQLAVANAEDAVATAQKKVDSLYYPRASDALIQNAYAQIQLDQKKLAEAQLSYRMVMNRRDANPEKAQALYNMTNAQLTVNSDIASYNWYTGKVSDVDAELYRADLAVAKATLADAQQQWDRLKNGVDPVSLAAAKAKVATAQESANRMLIVAPFDGEVIAVQATAGSPVSSGDAAIELVNRSTLKVDTLIDESDISAVAVGDKAEITLDSLPDVILKGKASLIDPIGNTVNGLVKYTVTVLLDLTDEPVLFGATANVVLATSAPHIVLAVPVAAVQSDTQGEYVLRLKSDGSTERISVVSGDLSGKLVTITGDLKAGDKVQLGSGTVTASATQSSNNNQQSGGGLLPGGSGPGAGGPPGG